MVYAPGPPGLCMRCYDKSPHRVAVRAGNLAASLDAAPAWLPGFVSYLETRHHAAAPAR